MRLVQVLFSGLGGHFPVAEALVRGDRERRWRHAFAFFGVGGLAPGYEEACRALDVEHVHVGKRPGVDLRAIRDVLRALGALRPDAIILHSVNLTAPVALWARVRGVPVVAVDHTANALKRTKEWSFTAMATTLPDGAVFLTRDYQHGVRDRLGPLARLVPTRIIPNGIDLAPLQTGCAPRLQDVLRVGMHSRFTRTKDHATLVAAFARLRARSDARLELRFAGDGDTLESVRRLANELGLDEGACTFLGMIPAARVPAFLSGLDLYVHPTHGETMCTAVMQAMAAGLPVVASDVSGVRELIRDGETGILVRPGDVTDLATAMEGLIADPRRREELGRAAAKAAANDFSHEVMFARYDAFLTELGRSRARSLPRSRELLR